MTPRVLRSPRAAGSAVVIAVALAFGLSACTPDDGVTDELRGAVVQIAERSAAGDFIGALAELDLLVEDLDAAVEEGAIDSAREREIRAAIDLVRADLEAAVAAANTPAPAPDDGEGGDGGGGDGDGNSGNGNGNGNGDGNGGGDGNGNGGGNGGGGNGDQSTEPTTAPPASEPPTTEPPATEPPATDTGDTGTDG